jgi:hypothetical protein
MFAFYLNTVWLESAVQVETETTIYDRFEPTGKRNDAM